MLGGCLLAPSRILWVVATGFLGISGWLLRVPMMFWVVVKAFLGCCGWFLGCSVRFLGWLHGILGIADSYVASYPIVLLAGLC